MSACLENAVTHRRMTARDLDAVMAIERQIYAHPWTRGNFSDSLEAGYQCWIAERAGEIIGYSVVMIAAGEAHLLNLSVAAQWQRRGVGGELLRFIIALARDCAVTGIFLEVRPTNAAARAMYARAGFAEIAVRRDYYPAGAAREDAIVMSLALDRAAPAGIARQGLKA